MSGNGEQIESTEQQRKPLSGVKLRALYITALFFVIVLILTPVMYLQRIGPKPLPGPMIERDVFAINHAEFGLEKFSIERAVYNLRENEDGDTELTFLVAAGPATMISEERNDPLKSVPRVEGTIIIAANQGDLQPGQVIGLKRGIGTIYYPNHLELSNLRVQIGVIDSDAMDLGVGGEAGELLDGGRLDRVLKFAFYTSLKHDPELERHH